MWGGRIYLAHEGTARCRDAIDAAVSFLDEHFRENIHLRAVAARMPSKPPKLRSAESR